MSSCSWTCIPHLCYMSCERFHMRTNHTVAIMFGKLGSNICKINTTLSKHTFKWLLCQIIFYFIFTRKKNHKNHNHLTLQQNPKINALTYNIWVVLDLYAHSYSIASTCHCSSKCSILAVTSINFFQPNIDFLSSFGCPPFHFTPSSCLPHAL